MPGQKRGKATISSLSQTVGMASGKIAKEVRFGLWVVPLLHQHSTFSALCCLSFLILFISLLPNLIFRICITEYPL